uniref:SHSP domain-containing protein n=1 Tax=Oryza punctata TaxID=4537 RepID=A0A0E0JX02_ORYPU
MRAGLLLWNQTRQQWVGNRRHNSQHQQPREPKIRLYQKCIEACYTLLAMALARLCLSEHLAAGRALPRPLHAAAANSHGPLNFHALFSSAAAETTTTGDGDPAKGDGHSREVTVVDRSRRRWPWRDLRDFVPFRLVDGIGSALSQGAETLTRPLERLAPSPPSSWLRPLTGKVREDEERYRLRFEVPGLGKDDVRVYVDDGVLVIHGEKRGGDGDGEWWAAAATYGSYHVGLILPEDALAQGITAEVRDGVLHVTVPRSPERKRSVTEVKVQ